MIVNEGEARDNYRFIEIETCNLVVLVKQASNLVVLCSLFLQNYFKKRGISIVFCEKLGLVALLAATRYM